MKVHTSLNELVQDCSTPGPQCPPRIWKFGSGELVAINAAIASCAQILKPPGARSYGPVHGLKTVAKPEGPTWCMQG